MDEHPCFCWCLPAGMAQLGSISGSSHTQPLARAAQGSPLVLSPWAVARFWRSRSRGQLCLLPWMTLRSCPHHPADTWCMAHDFTEAAQSPFTLFLWFHPFYNISRSCPALPTFTHPSILLWKHNPRIMHLSLYTHYFSYSFQLAFVTSKQKFPTHKFLKKHCYTWVSD